MRTSSGGWHRLSWATMLGLAALIAGACGDTDGAQSPAPTPELTSSSTSPVPSSPSATPEKTSAPPSPQVPDATAEEPRAAVVGEGTYCSPRGAVATFNDGATAYCARMQYTDASVWSRNASLAPNPVPPASAAAGPQIGEFCIGADIGRTAVDTYGNAIVCDNYAWVLDAGQTPSHPWVDGQREWSDCLESHTEDECREMLNPTG